MSSGVISRALTAEEAADDNPVECACGTHTARGDREKPPATTVRKFQHARTVRRTAVFRAAQVLMESDR